MCRYIHVSEKIIPEALIALDRLDKIGSDPVS
jgi:hypothetical protein